jgi:hypothetical protein
LPQARVSTTGRGARLPWLAVAALLLVYLGWGVEAALHEPVWNPVDEGGHYALVESLAAGRGWPSPLRPPVTPSDLPVWGLRDNLEAVQPPLYYYAMVPVKAVIEAAARASGGSTGAGLVHLRGVFGLRLLNALMMAATVLLAALATRALAPGARAAPVAVAASAFLFRGLVLDCVRVGNDALTALLTGVAFYLALRWRARLTPLRAGVVGLVVGLAFASKYTALAVAPVLGLFLLLAALRHAPRRHRRGRRGVRVVAAFAIGAAVVMAPVVVTNTARTGSASGATAFRALTPANVRMGGFSLVNLAGFTLNNFQTFVGGQMRPGHRPDNPIDTVVPPVVLGLVMLGLLALAMGRDLGLGRWEFGALLLGLPVQLLVLAVISFQTDANALTVGRYDGTVLLPLAMLMGLGLPALLRARRGPAVAAAYWVGAVVVALNEVGFIRDAWPPRHLL